MDFHYRRVWCSQAALSVDLSPFKRYSLDMAKGRKQLEFGARRRFSDDELDQVERLAGLLNQEQLANYFGMTSNVFTQCVNDDPRLDVAYRTGRAHTISQVAQTLVRKALDGDTQSLIFYLKTQGRWTEKLDVEVKGEVTLAQALRSMAETKVIEGEASDLGQPKAIEHDKALQSQALSSAVPRNKPSDDPDQTADKLERVVRQSYRTRKKPRDG